MGKLGPLNPPLVSNQPTRDFHPDCCQNKQQCIELSHLPPTSFSFSHTAVCAQINKSNHLFENAEI